MKLVEVSLEDWELPFKGLGMAVIDFMVLRRFDIVLSILRREMTLKGIEYASK